MYDSFGCRERGHVHRVRPLRRSTPGADGLARLDYQVHVFVIDHLIEVEARRVYLRRGFSSLFDYVKRGLGYTDAATWRRIGAMKLCTRIEGVRDRLWDGSLTLDAAAQLQAAFERRTRFQRRDRERARGAATGTGSAPRPNGSPRSDEQKPAPQPSPGPALDLSAQRALVEQAAGKSTREVRKMLAELDPALAVPADRVRPLGEGRWELKAVIDADCQRGLEQLKGFLSHVDPRMTLGQLVGRLVSEGLDRHDPGRPPRRGCRRTAPEVADRPLTGQAVSSDGGRAPAAKRSATYADAMTSAAVPAQRRPQPAGGGNSPANRQPNADWRATSAPKRSAPTGSTDSLAPHTQRDSDGRAPSEKRQERPAHIPTSAPNSRPRAARVIGRDAPPNMSGRITQRASVWDSG
ncbi:MAG: hypothetical protein OXQ31_00075 [Spirochaetaceae bacterium]|nr:hypothetical protein [Spirochaetaceae bacterium]